MPYLLIWKCIIATLQLPMMVEIHISNQNVKDNDKPQLRIDSHTIQYIPRNMHTVFALLCFVVVIHWLIFPYPSGLLHWHCGNLTIAPVPAKQPWWIWINTSCEFIMNDCITTTKQSTTKRWAYFLGYTVTIYGWHLFWISGVNRNAQCYIRVDRKQVFENHTRSMPCSHN